MSISSSTRKAGPYACNGATVAFPFAFKVFSVEDVRVVLTDADAVETDLTLGTHYAVALNADQDAGPGGAITTTAAYATGNKITLTSQVQNLQPVTLTNQGGFYPRVINTALDRLTIICQQLAEQVGRAVKTSISSASTPDELLADIGESVAIASSSADIAVDSASAAANSASTAQTAAANLPNATTAGSDKFLKSNSIGTAWEYQTAAQARASLAVVPGIDVQAYNPNIPVVSATKAEMEAGSEAALRSMSPLRVAQSVSKLAVARGVGGAQTYQNLTASRTLNTTYYNTTDLPIFVSAFATTASGTSNVSGYVDDVLVAKNQTSASGGANASGVVFIVPPGSSYKVAAAASVTWFELRS